MPGTVWMRSWRIRQDVFYEKTSSDINWISTDWPPQTKFPQFWCKILGQESANQTIWIVLSGEFLVGTLTTILGVKWKPIHPLIHPFIGNNRASLQEKDLWNWKSWVFQKIVWVWKWFVVELVFCVTRSVCKVLTLFCVSGVWNNFW